MKTGDAKLWVYFHARCGHDRQAAESHKSHLCNFVLAGISQVFLSDAFQAEKCMEHAAWTLQPGQEATITTDQPSSLYAHCEVERQARRISYEENKFSS